MTREEYNALPWHDDAITRRWKAENYAALHTLGRASFKRLVEAMTYCETWRTPFSDEILKRCGKTQAEMDMLRLDPRHYLSAVRRACAAQGVRLI